MERYLKETDSAYKMIFENLAKIVKSGETAGLIRKYSAIRDHHNRADRKIARAIIKEFGGLAERNASDAAAMIICADEKRYYENDIETAKCLLKKAASIGRNLGRNLEGIMIETVSEEELAILYDVAGCDYTNALASAIKAYDALDMGINHIFSKRHFKKLLGSYKDRIEHTLCILLSVGKGPQNGLNKSRMLADRLMKNSADLEHTDPSTAWNNYAAGVFAYAATDNYKKARECVSRMIAIGTRASLQGKDTSKKGDKRYLKVPDQIKEAAFYDMYAESMVFDKQPERLADAYNRWREAWLPDTSIDDYAKCYRDYRVLNYILPKLEAHFAVDRIRDRGRLSDVTGFIERTNSLLKEMGKPRHMMIRTAQ